ncbi:MAG: hypothetical protein WBX25_24840 [Rhodomicrobium sp.]
MAVAFKVNGRHVGWQDRRALGRPRTEGVLSQPFRPYTGRWSNSYIISAARMAAPFYSEAARMEARDDTERRYLFAPSESARGRPLPFVELVIDWSTLTAGLPSPSAQH